jgi:ATP-dependent Lhr-like helicase
VQPATQLHGRDGLAQIIGQLQGLELPAPAWEEQVLPARVRPYDPSDLEYLCLAGLVTWGRLAPHGSVAYHSEGQDDEAQAGDVAGGPRGRRRQAPTRSAPIAFVLRENLAAFHRRSKTAWQSAEGLSSAATEVAEYLHDHGASFLADISQGTRRLPSEVEDALWELVSRGLVSGDGVAGLRRLLQSGKRPHRRRSVTRPLPVGRWALWHSGADPATREDRVETIARQLLRRYGVVLRDLLARERAAPTWRELVDVYRTWEAQGRLRGGRFLAGPTGEQFALPEAVEALRAVRRSGVDEAPVVISAADPLNLAGILLPGSRVSPFSGLAIVHRNGVPVDVGPLGALLRTLR